jgi:hypothetical protein
MQQALVSLRMSDWGSCCCCNSQPVPWRNDDQHVPVALLLMGHNRR